LALQVRPGFGGAAAYVIRANFYATAFGAAGANYVIAAGGGDDRFHTV
jgi:hypothetical protein